MFGQDVKIPIGTVGTGDTGLAVDHVVTPTHVVAAAEACNMLAAKSGQMR